MPYRILVVDDEPAILEMLRYRLSMEGFEVFTASDGREALKTVRSRQPDLIILDVMLPEIDGFGLCRLIRQETQVPILMLTARDAESDKVLGLELGADDYMTKPFSHRELLARIRALLRRMERGGTAEAGEEVVRLGPLVIDGERFVITVAGQKMDVTPKEFFLLKLLAANAGRVLSREALLEKVWGYDYPGGTRTVDVHISRLRQKLGKICAEELIETVHGFGYRLREIKKAGG